MPYLPNPLWWELGPQDSAWPCLYGSARHKHATALIGFRILPVVLWDWNFMVVALLLWAQRGDLVPMALLGIAPAVAFCLVYTPMTPFGIILQNLSGGIHVPPQPLALLDVALATPESARGASELAREVWCSNSGSETCFVRRHLQLWLLLWNQSALQALVY